MNFLIPPWKHQTDAFEMAKRMRDLALFFEQGAGKTGTTINIIRWLSAVNKGLLPTLILCPKIAIRNWKKEFAMHSKIPQDRIVLLQGSGKKRVKTFLDNAYEQGHSHSAGSPRECIFITNYEAVEMEELLQLLLEWAPKILVADESHRLKSHESKRGKAIIRIADKAEHRYILTGTPILNSAMDIFTQYRILDGGETFSLPDPDGNGRRPMNFYEFRGIYFEDINKGMPAKNHFAKWMPRQETYEILNRKIYSKAIRVLTADCLDLPPLIRQTVDVELNPEQTRMYNEMKNEFITWVKEHDYGEIEKKWKLEAAKSDDPMFPNLEDWAKLKGIEFIPRAVVAQMALTKSLRLQQIVSGFVKTEDGVIVPVKENPRLEALEELLEDITPNHKVIVWATFQHNYKDIAQVCTNLKIPYVEIHGLIKDKDRQTAEDLFRTNEKYRVMIANQRAAGIAINMVEDKNIVKKGQRSFSIFYSKGFSYGDDLQAERRNYRGGSEVYENVTRIDLVATGTMDELVNQALADKKNIADQVLDWGLSGQI